MRHTARSAAVSLLVGTLAASVATIPASCAHVVGPTEFAKCMANEKDEAVMWIAIQRLLDGDGYEAALDALIAVAPDAVKCLLKKEAARKGAGPVDLQRAKRAREYLESHGSASLMRCGERETRLAHNQEDVGSNPAGATSTKKGSGEGDDLAARVGASPVEASPGVAGAAAPGADDPGVLVSRWASGGGSATVFPASGHRVGLRLQSSDGHVQQAEFDDNEAWNLVDALMSVSLQLSPGRGPGPGGGVGG